ncbi:stage II sporulation protein M [Leuconostoc gasicomitatum]|uniref:stage II sporulation protein M n=1 Tax=Leuconostoc gelidum group TaxID=3016637 RepID=UPI000BD5368E|nr:MULTISPECIES: stage II sporulation protein M [Leuconostoc gelidum group]MBZ5944919.1 stage II sporulation protein M [Leuconostoc gasicomitatum]MBZ5945820.1 stage II sporulation protein M [Leuconostoc gasicomitatum]MBZ5951146.1 stage II sporulation protein M [Leuconostoc gasicomitatum]MBZ5968515.1 stage II sporulation protein M [Leuconostoc gasicomitatum]MBZ5971851.1 stage II sporulation protein M [Leuconostoc gasicomitatum]
MVKGTRINQLAVVAFLINTIIYSISIIFGYFSYTNSPKIKITNLNMLDILQNNLFLSGKIIVFGMITFGLYSIFIVFMNGFILGNSLSSGNFEWNIMHIIPHGVFEIPAILISATLGMMSLIIIVNLIYYTKQKVALSKKNIFVYSKLIILIILLLIASSYVEAFGTIRIHNWADFFVIMVQIYVLFFSIFLYMKNKNHKTIIFMIFMLLCSAIAIMYI